MKFILPLNREKLYLFFAINGMVVIMDIAILYIYNYSGTLPCILLKCIGVDVWNTLAELSFPSTINIFFQSILCPNCVCVGRFSSAFIAENQKKNLMLHEKKSYARRKKI